jgi:CheY-like chemotaxis protein/nitrogen-specific signal transduction histidine kinase
MSEAVQMDPDSDPGEVLAREQAARARAERDSRAKDRLLALLAHELRNTLAPIRNAISILGRRPPPDAAAGHALAQLDRQSEHMARLLEEALDLFQLLQGKLELQPARVDLSDALAEAEAALRPLLNTQGVRLRVTPIAETVVVTADPGRLQQILALLLRRAVKQSPAGGEVEVEAASEGSAALVCVRDDGPGIAPEVLAHFFDPGAPDDASRPRAPGAAGIGLLLARGLAERLGGTLEAHSSGLGQGTCLAVRLPLRLASAAAPPVRACSAGPAAAAVRALCVDDDPEVAESLAQLLRDLGCEAIVAHSGPQALGLAQSHRPALVLLDLSLPGMDGYELARRLRQQPGLEPAVLVAVSGYGDDEERRRSRAAGIDQHLVKPLRAADLEAILAGVKAGASHVQP